MKILLATEGSSHSKAMVKKFSRTAFAPNTEVRIISVYDRSPQTTSVDPAGISNEYYVEVGKELQKKAEDAIENAGAALRKKNPKLSISTLIKGVPKSLILNEAEKFEADLMVVGSHGHGGIAGFLLGSVSLAVGSTHAKCSVEIVRIPDRNTIKRKMK